MANENKNSPRDAAIAVLAKAQKLLDKKTSSGEDIKIEDMKKSAEHSSGLHTVAYYGLDNSKHSAQQAALAVLANAQDLLSRTVSVPSEGMKKSAEQDSGMHTVAYYNLAKKENPDEKQDAKLGEEVEHLCEDHMIENAGAERKEGHKSVSKAECAKCIGGMQKFEFTDLYEDLAKMEKAENKEAPSNPAKPKISEEPIERDNQDFETKPGNAPENDHREEPTSPQPNQNPAAQGQGSNPPAGSVPGKGVHKLSFFMGHQHHKKTAKKMNPPGTPNG